MEDRMWDEQWGSDDDVPVDMEVVRERMKSVPLPNMYYDDIPSNINFQEDDEAHEEYKTPEEKPRIKTAKVAAANVAPNLLTGGAIAETGPPPDFSVWTVDDDLLLKNAIESGAAMEGLAKGGLPFSRRYTVRELRERWRALMYDPKISAKAATRMYEAEVAFLESMKKMFPNKQKFQDFVQKRRDKSVRATFKRKRSTVATGQDGGIQVNEQGVHGSESLGDRIGIGAVSEKLTDSVIQRSPSHSNGAVNNQVSKPEEDIQVCDDIPDAKTHVASGKVHSNGVPDIYVLSSDEDDDEYYSPEPKRPRVSSEQLICTFNTDATNDVPSFDDSFLQEASDDDRCDATSDFKSPEIHVERQEQKPLSLPSDNLCFTISNMRGMAFDQDRGKMKVSNEVAKPVVQPDVPPPPPASNHAPTQMASPKVTPVAPEVTTSTTLTDSTVNDPLPPEQQGVPSLDSDDEIASFSDVEEMILDMDLDPGDDDVPARPESKRMYRQNRKVLLRLEQAANASMQRSLVAKGAIAIFYGKKLRYYITKDEVSVGRSTQDNIVDIDLVKEGAANKVSRKQASIKLKEDGVFYLKNMGRRILHVNNVVIDTGQHIGLTSNCLIEVGGMWFIFEMNKKLVAQRKITL